MRFGYCRTGILGLSEAHRGPIPVGLAVTSQIENEQVVAGVVKVTSLVEGFAPVVGKAMDHDDAFVPGSGYPPSTEGQAVAGLEADILVCHSARGGCWSESSSCGVQRDELRGQAGCQPGRQDHRQGADCKAGRSLSTRPRGVRKWKDLR